MPTEPKQETPDVEATTDPSAAVECKHPQVEGTAWLSPWWVENTDWHPVKKQTAAAKPHNA
jgi:hypothetical protein